MLPSVKTAKEGMKREKEDTRIQDNEISMKNRGVNFSGKLAILG